MTFSSPSNSSTITGFILLGFPGPREEQILLFVLFSTVYLLTLMGNGSIICAVHWDQRLHTPMSSVSPYMFQKPCYRVDKLHLKLPTFIYPLSLHHGVLCPRPRSCIEGPISSWKKKAFSTCGSHLAVVSLFYRSVMVMYVSPTSEHEAGMHKIVTLFYSVFTPLINPVIYSLRNTDMKCAMKKLLGILP
ncbi:Olfactory receptor 11G2 [Sciurus carolinensis]|uniref:Olfactory receptor 11G2 n=1 Tax=Sciurus carolinensis TaxID=30640 RepID=A0AA41T4I4_SCICA|nr:Olfactory receptor 11G2 [Sciurus carolinensis]